MPDALPIELPCLRAGGDSNAAPLRAEVTLIFATGVTFNFPATFPMTTAGEQAVKEPARDTLLLGPFWLSATRPPQKALPPSGCLPVRRQWWRSIFHPHHRLLREHWIATRS